MDYILITHWGEKHGVHLIDISINIYMLIISGGFKIDLRVIVC